MYLDSYLIIQFKLNRLIVFIFSLILNLEFICLFSSHCPLCLTEAPNHQTKQILPVHMCHQRVKDMLNQVPEQQGGQPWNCLNHYRPQVTLTQN